MFYCFLVAGVTINVIFCVDVTLHSLTYSMTSHPQHSRQCSHPHSKAVVSFNFYDFIFTNIVLSTLVYIIFFSVKLLSLGCRQSQLCHHADYWHIKTSHSHASPKTGLLRGRPLWSTICLNENPLILIVGAFLFC